MRKTGRGATCHVTARLAVMASLKAIVVTVGGGGLGLEVRGQGALDTSHCGRFIESAGGGRQLCRRRSEAVSRGSRSVEEERRGGGWEEGEAGRGGGTGGQRRCRRRESDETGSGETRQARELLEAGHPGLAAVVGGGRGRREGRDWGGRHPCTVSRAAYQGGPVASFASPCSERAPAVAPGVGGARRAVHPLPPRFSWMR